MLFELPTVAPMMISMEMKKYCHVIKKLHVICSTHTNSKLKQVNAFKFQKLKDNITKDVVRWQPAD